MPIADSNKCFHVPTPTGSCDFEVKEFGMLFCTILDYDNKQLWLYLILLVLPKFDVTINGPESITSNDDTVGISVLGRLVKYYWA